jgi:hypothetical protein
VSIVCNREGQAISIAPLTDLNVRSIADTIFDFGLSMVYPATPVQVFEEFRTYSPSPIKHSKGYVSRTLKRNYVPNMTTVNSE